MAAQGSAPVIRSTPFMIYSVTKSIVATAVHMLADRGELDLDAPVSRYWPGFGKRGKDRITVAQLLSHTAGIPGKPGLLDLASRLSPRPMSSRVAALAPDYEPGSRRLPISATRYSSRSAWPIASRACPRAGTARPRPLIRATRRRIRPPGSSGTASS
ncbi:MAG: beta-lactamase family protein [Spirochaetes bacterium]|nr:beta-lactamase family protein [Spirochaetota bacterium]MBU1082005.1 beta-lactamase family protein [Spirochaetota bacterium]